METNTIMDAYTIAYSRREIADLNEDGISEVGLTFAEALLSGMHPTKATWDALRASERNHLRLGWNEVSKEDDVLEALMDGIVCALQEETDVHVNTRWLAKNAITDSEERGDFKRAYNIALALEEWEAAVPASQLEPDAVYDAIPVGSQDDTAVRIAEVYEGLGVDDETIAAAIAASSTAMGYITHATSAADEANTVSEMACDEVEQLPGYLEPEWPFDEQAVEVAALPFDERKQDVVNVWLVGYNARNTRRFGLDWIYNGEGQSKPYAVRQKAWARIRELEAEVTMSEYEFLRAMRSTTELAAQLSPSEQAHFCNVIARKTVEVVADEDLVGLLYGTVRETLAELLDLDLDDVEVWLKLYPGGAQDSYRLTFAEEQQGAALLRFVGSIGALKEPEDDGWRIYECKEWQQLHALLALRGRQSFSAVSDAVKASLKNGNGKYIHSGVKAVWRRFFAAEKKRKAKLEVKRLHTNGITVEQADGRVRFIEWNGLLRRATDLHVQEAKHESFLSALVSIGGQAKRVAEVMR